MRGLLLFVMTGTLFLFFIFFNNIFDNFNKKQLVISSICMFALMMFVFIIILFNFSVVPTRDAFNMQDTAMYFAQSGVDTINNNSPHVDYFGKFSNNYFLTIVFSLFFRMLNSLKIDNICLALSILATVGILFSVLFMYLIGIRIGGLNKSAKILLLCVMNPIYYILVLWVYTNVLSIPFFMAIIYFGISAYQDPQKGYFYLKCLLLAGCTVVGYFIRATIMIPVIAFAICICLMVVKDIKHIKKCLKGLLFCALIGMVLYKGISSWNESYFSSVSDRTYPITHWIMMASHGTGKNSPADSKYTKSFETREEKVKMTVQKAIENYQQYSLPELLSFEYEKLMVSWGHGDGGDIYSKIIQDTKQTKLNSWIIGDRSDLFRLYCSSFWLANLFSIIVALWHFLNSDRVLKYQFLFPLILLGGILFYCIWEVKASYTLPFIYIMILIAVDGFELVEVKMLSAVKSFQRSRKYISTFVILCSICCVCFMCYDKMVHSEVVLHDWSIRAAEGNASIEWIKEDNVIISQNFYTSKPFNKVEFMARADKKAISADARCSLKIVNGDNKEIYSGNIFAKDISKDGIVKVDVNKIIPQGKEKYTIQIVNESKNEGYMHFAQRGNEYIDIYEGTLKVNGKERNNDLRLCVYKEYQSSWCSRKIGMLINGMWILVAGGLSVWLFCSNEYVYKRKRGK